MHLTRRTLLKSSLAALAGCGAPLHKFPFDPGTAAGSGPGLTVDFFGTACFQFSWANTALLLDPFFSRFPIVRSGLGRIGPDPAQIDKYIPQLKRVNTVLVGHTHYDHAMALPYLVPHFTPNTRVIGNRTLKHTFAPLDLPVQWTVANNIAATPERNGTWVWNNDGNIRVLPIISSHPNHWSFIHLYRKSLTEDRKTPPTRAAHYQEGQPLAFLIDFMEPDGETVAHRVYAQTSSRGFPSGSLPQSILDERAVDIAVVSMDSCKQEARGETSVLDLVQPREVFFGHWDNFFLRKDQPPREVMKVDLPELYAHYLTDSSRVYRFPGFDTQYFFPNGAQ